MPLSRLHFDERNRKYSHICCHIRVAAIVIGCLQLIDFVYDLGNFAFYSIEKNNVDDDYSSSSRFTISSDHLKSLTDNDETSKQYDLMLRQRGAVAGLVWDSLAAISVIFMLYGIRSVRHLYLIPLLITYAATVAICMILALVLVIVAFRVQEFQQFSIVIAVAICAVGLYAYFFHIILRTYKYLAEKRRFLNDTTNIYIVPIGRGVDMIPHENYDVPPAYPGLLTEVNEQKDAKNVKGDDKIDDAEALPSYEEAQKLHSKPVDM